MNEIQPYIPGGEEEQAIQQAISTDSPVSTPSRPDLAAPEGYSNEITVDETTPEVTPRAQENVPWVQQKDTIKETINNLEVEDIEDNPNAVDPDTTVTFNSAATGDLIAQGEQAVANPPEPGFLDKLKGPLSATFKDMFNPDSLARAALLMAGGMATGLSPKQAMAWAGKDLLARNDAKHAATRSASAEKSDRHYELMKGGKYTPESVNNFIKSGYQDPLVPVGAALTTTGKSKHVFMEGSNKKVELIEAKQGGNTFYLDPKSGQPVGPTRYHENAHKVPNTDEYNAKIAEDLKTYEGTIEDVKEEHDAIKVDGKTVGYNTGVIASVAAGEAATFALENDVPPNIMTGVIETAMRDASIHASTSGKKVSSKAFKAFMDNAYIKATVGDDTLFQGADPKSMTKLFNRYGWKLKEASPDKFGQMNSTVLSSMIVSKARPRWTALEDKAEWEKKAKNNPGETAFTLWLNTELNDGIQEGGI